MNNNNNNNNNKNNIYTYCAQFVRSFLKVLFEVEFICCVLVVAGTVCFTLAENKQFAQKHIIDEHVHEPLANLHVKRPVEPIVLRETNTLRIKDHVIWEHTTLPHEFSRYSLDDSNNNVTSHDNNNNINILKEESAELLNVAIEKVQEPQKEKREIIQGFNNLLEEEEEQEEEDKEGSKQTATSVISHNHISKRKIIKKTPLGDVEVAITVAEVNNNVNDTMKQNESNAKETNTIVKDDEHRIVNNNNNNNNSNEQEE